MRSFILFITFALLSVTATAQPANDSVKLTVNNLFKAMLSSDTALLRSCFSDSAVLQTVAKSKSGNTVVKNESVEEFIQAIGGAKVGSLDERITYDVVKVDADLAIVWTPYSFYYNNTFSHCGVNSFQLVRLNNKWVIQYLIDTRRKTGCL